MIKIRKHLERLKVQAAILKRWTYYTYLLQFSYTKDAKIFSTQLKSYISHQNSRPTRLVRRQGG